jgi:gamma-glutamyltranspeptidase/glutathione hydrolase
MTLHLLAWRRLIGVAFVSLPPFLATAAQAQLAPPSAPEASTGRTAKKAGTATRDMVAAANPLRRKPDGRSSLRAAVPSMQPSRCSSC